MNFNRSILTPYLLQFVFYSGTVVWFIECLPKITSYISKQTSDSTNDGENAFTLKIESLELEESALIASSYSICFLIGYTINQVKSRYFRRFSNISFILVMLMWYNFDLPKLIPDDLEKFNVITEEKFYNLILSTTHIFAFSLGNLLCVLSSNNSRHYIFTIEYFSLIGVLYLLNTKFNQYVLWTCVITLIVCIVNIQYGIYNHMQTTFLASNKLHSCPYYNDYAMFLYQMYPVSVSIVFFVTIACGMFNKLDENTIHLCLLLSLSLLRLSSQISSNINRHHICIDQLLSFMGFVTLKHSLIMGYAYYVLCIPICSQILRHPLETVKGFVVIRELSMRDINTSSKFRDNVINMIHQHGSFRIPILDSSFIARCGIPRELSKYSINSTTSPFIKCITEFAGETIFSRDKDNVWSDMKQELRKCLTYPTFSAVDLSTDQIENTELFPCYKKGDAHELMSRIITRIMMVDVAGIVVDKELYEVTYENTLISEREYMADKIQNMKNVDLDCVYKSFDKLRNIVSTSIYVDLNGWFIKSLTLKTKEEIKTKEELLKHMDMWREENNMCMIKTCNEIFLMTTLAVPTTASLSSRCIHVVDYIRQTNSAYYEELIKAAVLFYNDNRKKNKTLKKPIINNKWIDFVVNVLYWYPPTILSLKLIRNSITDYEPGDIVMIALNCDQNAPSYENVYERYDYMLKNPQTNPGEALWKDDRICAGAYFAQNEAAFILGKLYDKYELKISKGKEADYLVRKINFDVELHPKTVI